MKLGVLCPDNSFPPLMLTLYRDLIRPWMEYASHVWRGSTHTDLLNRVESKVFLLNSPLLTDCLQSLTLRRNIASLAAFYLYFHAYCSSELANCMHLPLPRPRCTRLSTYSHPYSIHFTNGRDKEYLHSPIPFTCKLWNSLPLYFFSAYLWLELI